MFATAGGSLPGTDFRRAIEQVRELLPEVMPWPELPQRGAGSAMIGRGAALLVDMPVALGVDGWEVAAHLDAPARRARASWRSDLDDFEELCGDFEGVVKVGVAGPWTLSAMLHRARADVMLADRGARAAVAASLTEGVRELVADVERRAPRAQVIVQVDEPGLCAVAAGEISTASGLNQLAAIEPDELAGSLRPLAAGSVLHACCGTQWLSVGATAGFQQLYFDVSKLAGADTDSAAAWLDAGGSLVLGVLRADQVNQVPSPDRLVDVALRLMHRLGAGKGTADRVQLAPSCGLAGWEPAAARDAMRAVRRAAATTTEELAG